MPSVDAFTLGLGLSFVLGSVFAGGSGDGDGAPERWDGGIVDVCSGGEEDGWVGGVVLVGSLAAVSVIMRAVGAMPG